MKNFHFLILTIVCLVLQLRTEWAIGSEKTKAIFFNKPYKISQFNSITQEDFFNLLNQGMSKLSLGDIQGARKDFNEAISLNPNSARAYLGRGSTYFELEEYEKALDDFNQAIFLNPNLPGPYEMRAVIYYILKEYEKMFIDLDKTVTLYMEQEDIAEAQRVMQIRQRISQRIQYK